MSSTPSNRLPSKKELIDDLKALAAEHPDINITRKFYRNYGKFKESHWEGRFDTFGAFKDEAGVGFKPPVANPSSGFKAKTPQNTVEVVGNQMSLTLPKTRIQSLDDLIAHFKIDMEVWEVEKFVANAWEMGFKDGTGAPDTQPLYQVKATLRKRTNIEDASKELESLKSAAKDLALIPDPIIHSPVKTGNLLEISLNDAHFGKLAWSKETLGPDYDTKIAQKLFLESVESLLDRASGYKFDAILFVVGNDLIHSDDTEGRTTKGTYVDCDTRYYKTFEIVRQTITKCIERFRKVAPRVIVKMVQGNHDELSVWHLGDSLTALFGNYPDVEIDNAPTYRKYFQWGKCGLLLTHGDKGKRADFPLLFATERPDIFGGTTFREVHTGHYHQTKTEEFHGVRVRIIPSLSAADQWHSENGFTGQQRVAESYVFNTEQGLIAQFYHNADTTN